MVVVEAADPVLTTFNATVYYSGGEKDCTPGECISGSYEDNYQLIDTGDISEKYFNDPLPPGYLLKNIYIVFTGAFHCALVSPNSATVAIFINGQVHQESYPLPQQQLCCKNCHGSALVLPQNPPGQYAWFTGYNYNASNEIKLIVLSNAISLSSVTVQLYGLNAIPQIVSISPSVLPTTGGTITIQTSALYGSYFRYICLLQLQPTVQIFAQQVPTNPNAVMCTLPPVSNSGQYQLQLYPSTVAWTTQIYSIAVNYTFYQQPQIGVIVPNTGDPTSNTFITVYGMNFFASVNLTCMFGSVQVPAQYINQRTITCSAPTGVPGAIVPFTVSQNGASFANSTITFSYNDPNPIPFTPLNNVTKHINMWVIIGCGVLVAVITVASVSYIIYRRKCSPERYETIPDIEPNCVIPYSELDIKERIGKGSFGEVYRAYWRYTQVAVKKIGQPTPELVEELYEEVKLMTKLRHPNVVNFMACTTEPDVCLVQEFIERGSLYAVLHNRDILLENDHLRRFALDTCKGMGYLHASRIIHRDLKSHNLLVDKDWNIKVCDFGLSRALEETHRSTTLTACGTPCWTAPEILRGKRYTVKADVYSFGICLWEIVSREDPYAGTPPYQVVINVATKGARPLLSKQMLPAFTSVMTQSWAESPDIRPSFGELVEIFEKMEFPSASPFPIVNNRLRPSTSNSNLHGDNNNVSPNASPKSPGRKSKTNTPKLGISKTLRQSAHKKVKSPGKKRTEIGSPGGFAGEKSGKTDKPSDSSSPGEKGGSPNSM